jgi:hypothetical protein
LRICRRTFSSTARRNSASPSRPLWRARSTAGTIAASQPLVKARQMLDGLDSVERRADAAAAVVAADDHVLDLEDADRIFDRGTDGGVGMRQLGGEVGDVSDDEHLTGLRRGQDLRNDARIGAADIKNARILALARELEEIVALAGEIFAAELGVSVEEMLRHWRRPFEKRRRSRDRAAAGRRCSFRCSG